ncbi:bacteriohemerythrin [Undibacterium sp.]|uniref:bacteriohemerythrin n=1 Tax=Undibacterium sp. TaxID=1914977 RepID=UPI00375369CE
MVYFQWNSALSVGNTLIDCDHQNLIDIVNELYTAADLKQDCDILGDILQRLFDYTSEHFDREEEMMKLTGYPGFESHKMQHKKLLERVVRLQVSLAEKREYVAKETAELLKFWLTSHIYMADKELAMAIQKSGVRHP